MEVQAPKKSWFSRNWPWVVPLGGCLTIIIIFFVFLGSVIFGVSQAFTNSGPYQDAMAKVQSDEYVIEKLGEPIETNGIMNGSLKFENDEGSVDISIPIKGPDGEGRVYIVGTKNDGNWNYSELYVILEETNEQVDLLWGKGSDEN
ncbi:cytochrome c oxidase assembly factor Coa1 family protein [Aquimarina litoralis]|uniref:cytochrome c oxidase assembly factor Coa1 family protein n=1 Tax=Aquimarina litoralis TaxID=584605 RepID=UPI001C587E9A|nr:cytochrome c oxidase assembly factor Coa1 family protein [Aquimarina litoralis]MBW1298208.1 hypothetical protein [Aquimarina litoralis]